MIGILAARKEELAGVLTGVPVTPIEAPGEIVAFRGTIPESGGKETVVVLSGTGESRARAASTWLVRELNISALVITGFAGAADPTLTTGNLVLASDIYRLSGTALDWSVGELGNGLKPDPELLTLSRSAVEVAGIDFRQGPIVSLEMTAKTPGIKHWIGETYAATATDLDSFNIAEVATQAGIPFVCTRAILDPTDVELIDLVSEVDGAPSGGRMLTSARYTLRRPLDIPGLARLRKSTKIASESLSRFVNRFAYHISEYASY